MKRNFFRYLILLSLFFMGSSTAALAGFPPPVLQSGAVTAGHVATFCGNNCVNDGGSGGQSIAALQSSPGLSHFRAAMANVGTLNANVYVCHLGDSTVFEGQGNAGYSYPYQLAAMLSGNGKYVNTNAWLGGGGSGGRRATLDHRITVGNSFTYSADTSLVGNYWIATTNTNSLSFTPDIKTNRALVFYPINGLGSGTIDSDGLNPQTLDESGASALGTYTYSDPTGTNFHVYNLKEAAGTFGVIGLIAWNSANPQVVEINIGWDGSTSNDLVVSTNPWSPLNVITTLGCSLTFLEGSVINDLAAGNTPSQTTANLSSLITKFTAGGGDVILQTFQPQNPNGTHLNSVALQDSFVAAENALAVSLNIPVVDIYKRWVSYAAASILTPNPYFDTWVHLSQYGAYDIAAAEFDYISQISNYVSNSTANSQGSPVNVANFDGIGLWGKTSGIKYQGTNLISNPQGDTSSLAIGSGSLGSVVAGTSYLNTAVGNGVMASASLTTGALQNTGVGYQALAALTSGAANTAAGHQALNANTTGANNSAVGFGALLVNTTGQANTAVGYRAMRYNTTGADNTAVGFDALSGISSGSTTGSKNVAIGELALAANTTGASNVAIGYSVGSATGPTTGTNDILIGTTATCTAGGGASSHEFHLCGATADSISVTGMNTVSTEAATIRGTFTLPDIASDATHTDATVCEDTSTHTLYSGSGTLGICLGTSSARYKLKIKPVSDGIIAIMALKPVNFYYRNGIGDSGDKEQYGFLAEDVIKVLPKLTALDKEGRPNSVDYLAMVPVLVKAIQQQQYQLIGLMAFIGLLIIALMSMCTYAAIAKSRLRVYSKQNPVTPSKETLP